jgi:hypothetical protein
MFGTTKSRAKIFSKEHFLIEPQASILALPKWALALSEIGNYI